VERDSATRVQRVYKPVERIVFSNGVSLK